MVFFMPLLTETVLPAASVTSSSEEVWWSRTCWSLPVRIGQAVMEWMMGEAGCPTSRTGQFGTQDS